MLIPDVIKERQDMRRLEWSRLRHSSGTAGSYLKSYELFQGKKIYYKLSCFDSVHGITGHECINEIIVDRLLSILGIEHLHYQLIRAVLSIDGKEYETCICASEDFKEPGDSKIALDDYYDLKKQPEENIMDFCMRMGWEQYIYRMLVVDFLILNRDRHGANVEVLRSRRNSLVRPAPLFDHGISLLFQCGSEEAVAKVDVMEDKPVQCCVGTHSAMQNLKLIPSKELPRFRALEERDRTMLFSDLDGFLPQCYYDKIWEMIWTRWRYYENLCNKG